MYRKLFFSLFSFSLLWGCAENARAKVDLSVAGPQEFAGATVVVDGRTVGQLDYLMFHDSWWDRYLKWRYPEFPFHDVVALNIDLEPMALAPGSYLVRVEQAGLEPLEQAFQYPITAEGGFEVLFFELPPTPMNRLGYSEERK